MKNYQLISLLVISSLFGACTKKDSGEDNNNTNLKITMGVHCGWGLRFDSLSIENNNADLVQKFTDPTLNATISIVSQESLTTSEINALKAALDWNYFSSLNYNSGNLGSDGCDIWLKIDNGTQKHEIRFGLADTIPQLRPLTDQLDSLWSRMGEFPPDMLDNF
jgi:hypothetical protein